MKTPVRLIFAALLAIMGLFATVQASSAMPIAPSTHQQPAGSNLLQDVRWPCGPGRVENRWGRCVWVGRYGPRYYRAPRYYRPHYYYGRRFYRGPRYYRPYRHYRRW